MAIDDKVKRLYDAMKSDGDDVGTIEEFNDWFYRPGKEGYKNRKYVYDTFKAAGADVGKNYEEFASRLGYKAVQKKPAAPASSPKPSTSSNSTPASHSSKPANAPQAKASNDSPTWKPRPMNQIFNSPNQWTKDARAIAKRVSPNESYSKGASEGSRPSQSSTADVEDDQTPIVTPPDKVPSGDKPAWLLNAMAAREVEKGYALAASIGEQRKRNERVVESMTQKGRDRVKAARTLAGMAGTPTRVMGITSPSAADPKVKGQTTSQGNGSL